MALAATGAPPDRVFLEGSVDIDGQVTVSFGGNLKSSAFDTLNVPSIKPLAFACVVQNVKLLLSLHVTGFAVEHTVDVVYPVVRHFPFNSSSVELLAQRNTVKAFGTVT